MKFLLALTLCLFLTSVSVFSQETSPALEVLTLDQAISLAQSNNRQLKISQQDVLSANDQILAARTQRYPQFNIQLTGAALLTPVSISFPEGVFGTVSGTPIPNKDMLITTNPQFSGMAVAEAYQPLAQACCPWRRALAAFVFRANRRPRRSHLHHLASGSRAVFDFRPRPQNRKMGGPF